MSDLIVRVAADLTKFRENFKLVDNQIDTTSSALKTMTSAFDGSKTIASANAAVIAVDKLGGATKLTTDEQEKLNKILTDGIAQYAKLGKDAPQSMVDLQQATAAALQPTQSWTDQVIKADDAIVKVDKSTLSASDRVKELATGYVSGMLTFSAFTAAGSKVLGFLGDSVKEAAEAETAQKRLTIAMENQGTATPALIKHYDELARATQDVSTFSADAVKELEVMLIQVGNVGPEQMQRAITATTDLASAMGIDLEQAATVMAKAADGNTSALRKMGVELDDARVKGEGLEYIAGKIAERFGGQAAAELGTYAGKMKQLTNQYDDMKESVGRVIISSGAAANTMSQVAFASNVLSSAFEGNAESMGLVIAQAAANITGYEGLQRAIDLYRETLRKTTETEQEAIESLSKLEDVTVDVSKVTEFLANRQTQGKVHLDAYSQSVSDLVDKITGADLAGEVGRLSDAVWIAGDAITAFQMKGILRDIDQFLVEGAKLDNRLMSLYRSQQNFNDEVSTGYGAMLKIIGQTRSYNDALLELPPVLTDVVFRSEAVASATDMVTASAARSTAAALTWSEALDKVRAGLGVMHGEVGANTDFSEDKRREIQKAFDEGRYYGPVLAGGGTDKGGGPDWAALGFTPRAMGGPVTANEPYVVGERGPELFVPQSSGGIVPNHALGGGVSLTVNLHVAGHVVNSDNLAPVIGDGIISHMRNLGVRLG